MKQIEFILLKGIMDGIFVDFGQEMIIDEMIEFFFVDEKNWNF